MVGDEILKVIITRVVRDYHSDMRVMVQKIQKIILSRLKTLNHKDERDEGLLREVMKEENEGKDELYILCS